ncbi:YhdP family protein [Thauera sinica]|uniref:YhdP family protein n=1 Tax=Thauera sinica TaxID=2665146 RepID=A0ABW1ALZ0_9RHOO|nr:YhdP family protein [Thauera sp. K11]ATE60827.1 TIGR02099 family protein [Thauera sp. K11]
MNDPSPSSLDQTDAADPAAEARSASRARRVLRAAGLLALAAWFVLGTAVLLVRDVLLPRIDRYRGDIAAIASEALGLPVSIGAIDGDWSRLRPRLHLDDVVVADAEGRPALNLPRVDASFSWASLLQLSPHFSRLEIHSPRLAVRREADGSLFVAGLRVGAQAGGGGMLDWLLGQGQIVVRDASVSWTDALRGAPELQLERVDFRLDRRFGMHRFALLAQPPAALASMLDVRGELRRLSADDPLRAAGRLYLSLERANLGGWRAWVDYPLPLQGEGAVRAWVDLGERHGDEPRTAAVTADVALGAVDTRLGDTLPELHLNRLAGRLSVSRRADGFDVSTRQLALETGGGLRVVPTDFSLQVRNAADGKMAQGSLRANRLDFAALAGLAAYLPFGDAVRARLAGFDPRGELSGLRLDWRGEAAAPEAWTLAGDFAGVGVAAHDGLPGLGGLSGHVEGNERSGRYRIDGRDVHLDLPEVFESSRLDFSVLRAEGGWQRRDGRLEIALDTAGFDNADATGSASGRYWPQPGGAGEIDLQARLTRVEGTSVWRYLPRVVNRDTHNWVRSAIRRAVVPDARLRLKGMLDDFPFRDGKGQFLVSIKLADALLEYAPGWPAIDGIHGEVRFEGPGMRIEAPSARIFGVQLAGVVADVPDLDVLPSEIMTITGKATGPTADFLRFVAESPVAGHIDHFTDGMRAEGGGTLDLRLVMPLRSANDTTVRGDYRFAANRLWPIDGLPALDAAGGRLTFTEKALAIPEARAQMLGAPLRLTARTEADGSVRFEAAGAASLGALRAEWPQAADWTVADHVSGSAPWKADIRVGRTGTEVLVTSDLDGMSTSLPAPFNKPANESWPLRVKFAHPSDGGPPSLEADLAGRVSARLQKDAAGGSAWRGGVGILQPVRGAEKGVMVTAEFDSLDVDAWRRALTTDGDAPAGADAAPAGEPALALAGVAMQAREVRAFGQTLKGVQLRALADAGGWKARLDSDLAVGEFDWRHAGDGTLNAHFRHLTVGSDGDEHAKSAAAPDEAPPRRLPGVDIVADRFSLHGKELGRLEVVARNRGGLWQLERLSVANADGRLTSSGRWQAAGRQLTDLDFRLETPDVGRFSRRFGYPDAVRGGQATLAGKLSWRGAPTRIDFPSLSGSMTLEARDGQFNKLEPGVGRLLGILSLQALPRRITLDFRDVFSSGFAFDRISGSIDVARGVLRTDDLEIRGPAARIRMRGSADIEAETQDLKVAVQPTLSESVAVGAAAGLVNPVAGVVAYVAQKVLSDPIEKFFAYEYTITGTWDDPVVSKSGSAAADLAPGRGGNER